MKVMSGMTKMIGIPHMEGCSVIEAAEQAEKNNDMKALKWCARRLYWLYEEGEDYDSGMFSTSENLFNKAWAEALKNDPPPESIAAIINREGKLKAIIAEDVEEALDALKAFFEYNLSGKSYWAAMEKINVLQAAFETTEAGQ